MALIKTAQELADLAAGGQILARILNLVAAAVKPGVSTLELDTLAREAMKKAGVEPAFEGYQIGRDGPRYPAVLCSSVDDEVVHGIPRKEKILREGEIIGLDLGVIHKGLYTDTAVTVGVGTISRENAELIRFTKLALIAGIEEVKPGNTIGDVGHAIESVARNNGLAVIRDLVGHGVGHALHEKPDVPNYGKPGTGEKLLAGMVIAIEPMFTRGDWRVRFLDDGWTVVTADNSPAAHFEHTVAVTETGHQVLTLLN
ncbi:MAG: type I methionyl aminopeptidase [Candidatus Doudnabacteria bacterium RIFCSPHIGHO2_01_FULL_49_9]|uniref:Methionine aminopeptidase n=1 Tax=Candidatus Doudnabacteria bacterium RIFCSPHIGHO2_01_FULL_49_9 TaxID=1817827 RepID=A0A1F5NY74_9BACT|nr:MAG: type I methionyl aminopeptidase [Candidatus Doudnabacteria bacterium RIFCSPHIGHO2_01_FULL_49_9]